MSAERGAPRTGERAADRGTGAPRLARLEARVGLAIATGVLAYLAFPGVAIWPLAFIAWLPLFAALRGVRARRGLWLGFVAGFAMHAFAMRFLWATVRAESGFGPVATTLVWIGAVALHGGKTAILGAIAAPGAGKEASAARFFVGLVASELVVPGVFPWYFGASLAAAPVWIQTADIAGPIGLTCVAALPAILGAEAVWRNRRGLALLAMALPGFALGYGLFRMGSVGKNSENDARPEILKVGVVEPHAERDDPEQALSSMHACAREAVSRGAEMVVFPEGALPFAVPDAWLASAHLPVSAGIGVPVAIGVLLVERATSVRNAAMFLDAAGDLRGIYVKRRLLPFAERMPFSDWLPWLQGLSPRTGHFVPGEGSQLWHHGIWQFGPLICYEDLFPDLAGRAAEDGANVLMNLTNDAWFDGSAAPEMHLALASLRAVETRRDLVRSTTTGVSAIVDAAGVVRQRTDGSASATCKILVGSVDRRTTRTIAARIGSVPWIVVLAGALLARLLRAARRVGSRKTT